LKHLVALLCLMICSFSFAGIGIVSETKGTSCEIQRGKTKLPGTKGSEIETMDTYVTGGCVSSITFKDDTKVRVTENSRLLIDDFVYDPKQSSSGKLALKVAMGTVRYASGQVAKNNPQSVDIKTPTATIAVRGTDFNMTVDETGQSLVILVPSCKDENDIKKYELEENRCKVGKIEVTTLAGTVTLDQAFQATYVMSAMQTPTPPVVLNMIEGKIGNNLIISKPNEIQKLTRDGGKSKRDLEMEELEAEQARQLANRIEKDVPKSTVVLQFTYSDGAKGCNPTRDVCVSWEKPTGENLQSKGKGIAFRNNPDHLTEVKTQGYESNTTINVTHDDSLATAVIGSGDVGGNVINIKQNTGVLKK